LSDRLTATTPAAGLSMTADIDRQLAPALSSNSAAARRSAANAGSVTLTADVGG